MTSSSRSIGICLSAVLVAIIALIMLAFAGIATWITSARISEQLGARLDGYINTASVGLEAPLWNLDHTIAEGYLDSLMLDPSIAYAHLAATDGHVIERRRAGLDELDFADFSEPGDYEAREVTIRRGDEALGRLQLVASRAAARDEILENTLAIIALACLVLTTVTVAIVVISRRYVARPLAELQQSAAAIGAGNLQARIDVEGRDEIGGLARTFDAMRRSIIDLIDELGESNRQLELTNETLEERVRMRTEEALATRQQLVDAVESTSEGFAFFDADDRLVLNNTQYEKLLYGGTGIEIRPGLTFEEILRLGIAKGLIAHEEANDEAFIARRLRQHRNPGAPILQRRGERTWIQINERRISDGGTVAVFSDVSELKNREADLTEKTDTLQHLSSQLAKYLSPQIYESIFKGDQEVKVASSRKKLTVFFSDIEDFTEIAEGMESEELTSLLNSYLTEMSRIALEHGATIDKYVGDAILVFFGDPESRGVREDALACVKMAVAMAKRMRELQGQWSRAGIIRPLRCRIGIHTDYCTVGNFGSESRMDYTIIGRAVNTAARLESVAEPGQILISYATYAQVRDQLPCEARGQVEVKGIARPVDVFQVLLDDTAVPEVAVRKDETSARLEIDVSRLTEAERDKFGALLQTMLARLTATNGDRKTEPTGRE